MGLRSDLEPPEAGVVTLKHYLPEKGRGLTLDSQDGGSSERSPSSSCLGSAAAGSANPN